MPARRIGHTQLVLRDPLGHFGHRPLDVDALRAAAEAGAALRAAEHDAPPPRDRDSDDLVRRVEGLLRWSAG